MHKNQNLSQNAKYLGDPPPPPPPPKKKKKKKKTLTRDKHMNKYK